MKNRHETNHTYINFVLTYGWDCMKPAMKVLFYKNCIFSQFFLALLIIIGQKLVEQYSIF